ncbi:lysophosphatidic acid receptor 6-like [Carassius auratus]|uniref:Lysophosphatidic acid receptor 6-like n=1 Tax=Carassius auratus TaxID=7957 RepID=A0A6P6KMD3_CARAU|nr:lysophosphatidic acid receptor 6-like [Carassius auratus]
MPNLTNMTCPKSEKDQVFVAVYSVVFIFGLILNLTALVVFFRNSKSRSHTTVYMIHLAFADIILVCTLPVRIYYHGGLGVPSPTICEFAGVILLSNMYSSILLLTCISLDRCVAVCFPMSSRVREGRKKAWCVCLGIWILTITTSLLIYFQEKQNNQENKNNITCFSDFPRISTQKPALVSTLIVGFGMPLTVMIASWVTQGKY